MPKNEESCVEWLERVRSTSPDREVRIVAVQTLNTWNRLLASWKSRGVKTRRSLWDLLSGTKDVRGSIFHFDTPVSVRSGDESFIFPILAEACEYRGRTTPDQAIRMGVPVFSHRVPQDAKWGNKVLKT